MQIGKGEIAILGVVLVAAVLAFPAVRDSYMFETLFISICAGLGIR